MAKKPHDTTDDNKTEKLVLPKEARVMMVSALENSGDMKADEYDDATVLKNYNAYTLGLEKRVTNYEVSQETKSINMYIAQAANIKNIRVEDKEFIMRLFKMNVQPFYLHLFKDDDKDLKDRDLWKIINKSGISPIKEVSDLGKMKRSPVRPKVI